MPQPQPRQQSRLNDIQMLQRHFMFKQFQEMQRQQQLQEFGDAGQQNYINQQSMINKHASGSQFPPLINGTPIHDTSQMYMVGNMDLVQRGGSPAVQGFSNGLAFSQAQSQDLHSMGLLAHQLDVSLSGTPIAITGNKLSQCSPLQGASRDSTNMLTKGRNNPAEKSITQSSTLSKSFMSNQRNELDSGIRGNLQQVNPSQQDFGGRQERACWPGLFPENTTNIIPSQDLASLDPLEQKILFNMNDNSWEASFGRCGSMGPGGGLDNRLEHTDQLSAFPSVQSGSWSALMQSAVAETSSSDTGLQEEWSGLSYQNPELSMDNQPSNFVDNGKQHTSWVDSNLHSASSLNSKPEFLFNNSNSSSFPGFQQSVTQFSFKQKDEMHSNTSHEPIQQSPKNSSKWWDCDPQQKQPIEGGQPVQRHSPLQGAWPGQNYEHSENDAHQQSISSYTDGAQPCNNLTGDINGVAHKDPNSPWKTYNNHVSGSFYDSVGGLELVKSGKVNKVVDRGYSQLNRFATVPKSSEMYEKRETCFQRENSIDSYHSNTSQHNITGHELRENVWLHESDSRSVAEGNQKPSGQVQCQQVPRGLSDHEQGYAGHFKFIGNNSYNGIDLEKGCLPDIQRNLKESEDVPLRSNVGSSISAFFDRSVGFHGPSLTTQKSQHMLELLDKVDKSTEYRPGMHFGSKDSTSSEVPLAESPDASVAQSYNKSSPSQCFGLRLAPPSQWLPNTNCFESSQSSPKTGNSPATFPSGPDARNQLQNQHKCAVPVSRQSPQATLPGVRSRFSDFNPVTSDKYQKVEFKMRPPNVWTNVPTQQNLSGTEPRNVPFSFLPSPDSTNVSLETASRVPQELHDQTYFEGGSNSRDIDPCSMNSQGFDYGGEKLRKERSGQQISMEILNPVLQTGKLSHGQEYVPKNLSEANAVAPAPLITRSQQQGFYRGRHSDNQSPEISARDLETFGCSLKPSHVPPENYSLLHQVRTLKNVETDPSNWVSANYNGVDSDQSLYEQNSGVRNLVKSELNEVSQLNSFPSGDNKVLHFSSEERGDPSQPLLQDTYQELVLFGQNDSQSYSFSSSLESNRREQSQISLQMAPSWFKHYETLRNGQMLSMYNASTAKNAAQQFSLGKPFENSAGSSQVSAVWPTTAISSVAVTHLSPPYVLPPNVTDQNLSVLRPKKRKIAPFEFLPWHKEITQGSQRLPNISMAELEWAEATNRLIEKVENAAEIIEDGLSMHRPKKRLALTTRLMQQLFRPPQSVILSGDASTNCVSVAYFASRLALGDACCLTSNSPMRSDISDMSSLIPKPSERIRDQDFSKFMEDVINQLKRMEGDFLMVDKRASILDVRVESEELDKFSVINRLAKFHSRGQAGAAETSTSSCPPLTAPKMYPQRYVKALPMPRTVPEGAQCLSL